MRADHEPAAGSLSKQGAGNSSTIPHAVGVDDFDASDWHGLYMPTQGKHASRAPAANRRHIHTIPAMAIH
jgi:hypothetical protein